MDRTEIKVINRESGVVDSIDVISGIQYKDASSCSEKYLVGEHLVLRSNKSDINRLKGGGYFVVSNGEILFPYIENSISI